MYDLWPCVIGSLRYKGPNDVLAECVPQRRLDEEVRRLPIRILRVICPQYHQQGSQGVYNDNDALFCTRLTYFILFLIRDSNFEVDRKPQFSN